MLFNIPRRALWITGVLGGIGWGMKAILLHTFMHEQVVLTSFIAACAIGFLGMYFAHRVHTPPVVFTIPAVINMIPGKYGYEFMMGLIKLVTVQSGETQHTQVIYDTIKLGLQTGFITLGLAFGVIAPMLLLNTYTVKGKDLHKFIAKKIKRKGSNKSNLTEI
ncbi:membrane protein [Capnocytophaga felis]|uniref:Membrane protein n=2 Tax=Capnocytophaga felis TaxID=2267611 RepID=A0A5M4BAE6_9FLAO|nr:membrane protein [Capnocytophaga felis]GET49052.1 membrane protein [Capnocytophaga felis]